MEGKVKQKSKAKQEERICHVCNEPIRQKGDWDNPRHDPRYSSLWLCKDHWSKVTRARDSAYDRTVAIERQRVDDKKAKRKITKPIDAIDATVINE